MRKLVSEFAIKAAALGGLALGGLVLAAGMLISSPAEARVHVFLGVGPWWGWPGPYYYAPPVVYAPPVYYPPAPSYYAPAPSYYAPTAAPAPVPPAAASQSWYYCDNPAGYYPYVSTCAAGWRQVPSRPTQSH